MARASTHTVQRLFVAAGLACVGCGPPPESRFEQCVLEPEPDPFDGVGVDGASGVTPVTLGTSDGANFEPYVDGASIPLVLGLQGGYMITPTLRIETLPDDPESFCLAVSVTHAMAGAEISPGFQGTFQFTRRGDAAYTTEVFDLLSYNDAIRGQSLSLTLAVDENGTWVTDSKTIVLE